MVSKVLFLVLVGCAFALAKPVDESAEVRRPKVEIIKISEEEAKEIINEVDNAFKNIWGKIMTPHGLGDLKNIFDKFKGIFDKVVSQHKPHESSESIESVESQESVESVKTAQSKESVESDESINAQG